MDRDAVASQLRRTYAVACRGSDTSAANAVVGELSALARLLLGPSFRFEPDPAHKPAFSVIHGGGARSDERPSERFIDEPEAG